MNKGELESAVLAELDRLCEVIGVLGTREIRERTLLIREETAIEDDAIDAEWEADEGIFIQVGADLTAVLADLCTAALEDLGFRRIDGGIHFAEWHRQVLRFSKAEALDILLGGRTDDDLVGTLVAPMHLLLGRETRRRSVVDPFTIEPTIGSFAPTFRVSTVKGLSGNAIGSDDRESWLLARRQGITATDARRLVRKNGIPSVQQNALLHEKLWGETEFNTDAMRYGSEREAAIASWIQEHFAIEPNRLLLHGQNPRHLATPDGLGVGSVAEIKTSVHPFGRCARRFSDQVQWQLHVIGATRALFVVENRDTLTREWSWIDRDEARIRLLVEHADYFLERLDDARANAITPAPRVVTPQPLAPGAPRRPVFFQDESDLPADDAERWSSAESNDLEARYRDGFELVDLADHFARTTRSVVFELSARMLVTEGNLVDASAARFGTYWTEGERSSVTNLYKPGESILPIARLLGRDQLSIAFVLLGERIVARRAG